MNNWWKILHQGERQGWLTYKDLASCVAEGTSTVEVIDAINICKKLGIQFLSNVEGLPVAQNIQEMCEAQDLEDRMASLDPEILEDVLIEDEAQQEAKEKRGRK